MKPRFCGQWFSERGLSWPGFIFNYPSLFFLHLSPALRYIERIVGDFCVITAPSVSPSVIRNHMQAPTMFGRQMTIPQSICH